MGRGGVGVVVNGGGGGGDKHVRECKSVVRLVQYIIKT